MNARRLLAAYPPAWRARYGPELEELLTQVAVDGSLPWRARVDVVADGLRERLTPGSRRRGGAMLVLWAWALFVCAGVVVAKTSEHWDATLRGGHGLASAAFAGLDVGAGVGSACVLAGIAVTVPGLTALVAGGGGRAMRPALTRAIAVTVVLAAAFAGLLVWAHGLSPAQRDGRDARYAAACALCAVVGAAGLAAWVSLAAQVARGLEIEPPWVPRARGWLAAGAALSMAVMAAATLTWWIAVARAAPAALVGGHGAASPWVPQLVGAAAAMCVAAALGVAGARRALARDPFAGKPGDRLYQSRLSALLGSVVMGRFRDRR